jgi:hypothetical protein
MQVENGGKMTRLFTRVTVATLIVFAFASFVLAQEPDAVKVEMYQRFVDNRLPHPDIAYQAARDYLQKYANDKDKYTEYLGRWALAYERDERKRILPVLINQKNFAQAYRVGAQILADEPDYLRAQIDLGYAGYLAASAKDETHNAESLAYSQKAIEAIESGKAPADWAPFKGKDDTLAYLYYSRGFLTLKTNHYDESIDLLLKAAAFESDIRKTASTYYFLAVAYESGTYKTLSSAYQSTYAGKPETPESKAALEKLNVLMDRIIDAYARAIATAGTDSKTEQSRKEWLEQLNSYYKFRHNGSDTGQTEFIARALESPLPSKP